MAFLAPYAPARAYKVRTRKTASRVRYKTRAKAKPKTGGKMRVPVGAAIEIASAGYRYLKTRRMRKKRLGQKVTPTAAGSTMSYYTAGTKSMPKMMRDMFKTNRVYDTSALSSFRIDSNVYGRQFTGVRQLYSAASFNTDVTRAVTPAPTFEQIETSSLFYSDFELISTFTNMELTTSYLDIYEIEPRFHIPGGNDPATLWDAGLFSEGAVTNAVNFVYETPFKSRLFCLYYKVCKIIKIELSPGQSHKHKATYHINRRVDGSILRTYDIVRDVTKFQMYVVSGTPINDATDNTLVSTSTVAMDVVNRLSYKYIRDVVIRDSYVSTTALGAITTANVINDTTIKPDAEA